MKYSILSILLGCLFFSLIQGQNQTDSGSNQPFFVPNNPSFNSDWLTLVKYYAPFLLAPIVVGFLMSVLLTCLNCVTCCCPKCCCAPPCCFNSKFAIAILYTAGFVVIIAGCVVAWYHAPLFTEGAHIIYNDVSSAVDQVVDFFERSADKVKNIITDLEDALIPAFDQKALNNTSHSVHSLINDTRSVLKQMNDTINNISSQYSQVKAQLVYINSEKQAMGITANTPDPNSIPNLNTMDVFNMTKLEEGLDQMANDADSISSQIANAISDPTNFNLPKDFSFFPNFTFPFNFSSILDKIDFGVDKILSLTGLSNPISFVNETLSKIPISYSDIQQIGNLIDQNGGIYTVLVCVFGGSIVIAYFIWYAGLCTLTILHRAPFCWSALIVVFLGIAVGIHLGFGTISNDFCTQRYEIIQAGASSALSAAENANLPQAVMGPLKKILADPDRLLACSGNETIFGLYNISLWDDLGFKDIIDGLLNGTSLPEFFPNSTSVDQGIEPLLAQEATLNSTLNNYKSQIPQEYNELVDFQNNLQNLSDIYGCAFIPPSPPPPCTNCCHIANLNDSTNTLLGLFDQINPEIDHLLQLMGQLNNLLDQLKDARRSIVDILATSLKFPDLGSSVAGDILNTLGDCSWLGTFWSSIVGEALCNKISPALLWIGWSFAAVGVAMLFLTPVIVWSLNLDENGMI